MTQKNAKVRVIRANYQLRSRIGTGPIDYKAIESCQKLIDENKIEFSPIAQEFLENLSQTIRKTRSTEMSEQEALSRMTDIVMQLKANAPIFHYALVGKLAEVMLGFLESLAHIDKNAVEIVEAHHTTLSAIVEKQMKGDGGEYGHALREELIHACERYHRNNENKKPGQKN